MAEKDNLMKEKVDHSGIFDFKGLYGFAHGWFTEEGYGVVEDKYSEKVSGSTRDITVEWKASKEFSDYFKIEHKLKLSVEKMSDVEVEIDGEKKQMNKGKVEVQIGTTLVTDQKSKWDKSSFSRFLRDVYDKFVIPARKDGMKDKALGDGQGLKEQIKGYLDLYGRR